MKRATLHSLLIVGLMLAPAAAIVWLASERYERVAGSDEAFARMRAEAYGALSALRAEGDLATRNATRFNRLAAEGVVGSVDKLALIDRLEQSIDPWRGEVVRYALSGSTAGGLAGAERLQSHDLQRLRLSLDLSPRHEGALLAMLGAVRDELGGVSEVERCEITRASDDASAAGLKANCSIDWYVFVPGGMAPLAEAGP